MKIPTLDDLKKASAGLMDTAKSAGLGGMVDKLKAGIESVGERMINPDSVAETTTIVKDEPTKPSAPMTESVPQTPAPAPANVHVLLQEMRIVLVELSQSQVSQDALIKKINSQFITLALALEPEQKQQNDEDK